MKKVLSIILTFSITFLTMNVNAIERITPKTITVDISKDLDTVNYQGLSKYEVQPQPPKIIDKRKQGMKLMYAGLGVTVAGLIVTVGSIAADGPGPAIAGAIISLGGLSMTIAGAAIKSNADIDDEIKHEKELKRVKVY